MHFEQNICQKKGTIQDRSMADISGYCANMEIIANGHVGWFVEHWHRLCHQYD
jgi:hypothetical protein